MKRSEIVDIIKKHIKGPFLRGHYWSEEELTMYSSSILKAIESQGMLPPDTIKPPKLTEQFILNRLVWEEEDVE